MTVQQRDILPAYNPAQLSQRPQVLPPHKGRFLHVHLMQLHPHPGKLLLPHTVDRLPEIGRRVYLISCRLKQGHVIQFKLRHKAALLAAGRKAGALKEE